MRRSAPQLRELLLRLPRLARRAEAEHVAGGGPDELGVAVEAALATVDGTAAQLALAQPRQSHRAAGGDLGLQHLVRPDRQHDEREQEAAEARHAGQHVGTPEPRQGAAVILGDLLQDLVGGEGLTVR